MISIDILSNLFTSAFVVGIATYFIQKRIDNRFNRIEEFQKTLITIRKERYDTLLKTLQEVWEKIIETEYYIRHDMPDQFIEAQRNELNHINFDSTPLKEAFIFIEKRSILLNESLSKETSDFFVNHLQSTYNGFITILNKIPRGQVTLDEVNAFIPTALGRQYKNDLNTLKKKYEEQSKKILYEDKQI
ncbi:hypothetical protein BC749_101601 [Flavobacterium araucananum]|uniref:Uncharacterized protein n=1 Tax=Flavobacterium araucananum TaxID=946678 RepID=A0A227P0J2_9FLAO|nr:hypothetical protein [Flavobacterium araucananum]OXG03391.1 hypothetical protein B0A64_17325 [Flavobacterium araucananum]PWK02535.1 hypothetical protein BC749_101601 [Flavobacterium araucananum]